MTDAQQKAAAKQFVKDWSGKGYEKGHSQPFWLALLSRVYGVEHPDQFIHFEDQIIMERLKGVADIRRETKTATVQAQAETPILFSQIRQPKTAYLAIPEVSSQNRKYIPIGFLLADTIASNKLFLVPDANLYMFGVMISNVHMAWMRAVCGRLKSDYSYSPAIYNNFPWPTPTPAQKAKIEETAQAILDARAKYPDCSLADLYDELTMPGELRTAHQQNDKAVMQAYGFWGKLNTETECVAELMKMYQKLTK